MTEEEISRRIDRLERDNRRLKGFAAAVVIVLAALGAVSAARPVPQKIAAHEFDVVDGSGETRVMLGVIEGGPRIGLFDAQGKPRAAMGEAADGSPVVHSQDSRGFAMDLGSTGTVNIMTGQTQQTSAASIIMFGKDHHVIWQAP